MNKYLTEFIGTLMLMFVIYLTASQGLPLAPLAIGSTLMVMVYMGGPISGGHYNPAVTISLAVLKKLSWKTAGYYIVSQLLGAVVASVIAGVIIGFGFTPLPAPNVPVVSAFLIEFMFSFALVLVICNVAASEKNAGNSYFGLAIGFTIFVGALAGGSISGGAYNPAVGIGPALVASLTNGQSLHHIWLYLIAPISGGLLATVAYRIQNSENL